VANRIGVLREARGLSLEALSIEAGTTNQQISLLENGKRRLTVDWLVRLSTALACHPWELVAEDLPEPLLPAEIRLLERFRDLPRAQQDGLLMFLDTLAVAPTRRKAATAK
jgi:transcriptional regulator with XRE-family HTH domain